MSIFMLIVLAAIGVWAYASWASLLDRYIFARSPNGKILLKADGSRPWVLPEALMLYPVRGYAHKTFDFCRIARGQHGCDCEADHEAIINKYNQRMGFTP